MPIRIIKNTFTDIFSNDLNFYQSNAGDKITLTTKIEANIQTTETTTLSIKLNAIDNEMELLGDASWLEEGHRVDDTVNFKVFLKSDGTLDRDLSRTVTYVDDTIMRLDGGFGASFDDTLYVKRVVNSRVHSDLDVNINHVSNNSNVVLGSLIDGELTTARFNDIDGLSVSSSVNAVLVGNQSGQYLISGTVTRLADANDSRVYDVALTYINSGVYDSEWFDLGNCLKMALSYKFSSLADEPNFITTLNYTETANTGWFGDAYNTSVVDSTLINGISSIDYAVPTTVSFIIDTADTEFYLGAQYVSIDPDYYKNQTENQNELSLLLDAYVPLAVGTYTSEGGFYEITVDSIVTVSTEHTITITFTPLTGFEGKINAFDEGDRLFYIWCKAGNVNHLVFNNQLTKYVDLQQDLTTDVFTLIRHNSNITTATVNQTNTTNNTEDDLALFGKFDLPIDTIYKGIRCKIIAKNISNDEFFILEEMFFNFAGQSINSDGQYVLNMSQNVSNNLPTSSAKKTAEVINDLSKNKCTVYYPFINRWESWLTQNNALIDFYPNQNKDWKNYVNGDWGVYARLSLEGEEIEYFKDVLVPQVNYDTEPNITSVIKLYRPDNTLVNNVFKGETMRIEATHTLTVNTINDYWGQITIEDFEGQPRWLMSTEYKDDSNPNNPLKVITGYTKLKSTLSGDLKYITLECSLDTNLIDVNKIKITSKVLFNENEAPPTGFEFQNGDAVQTQLNEYLTPQ